MEGRLDTYLWRGSGQAGVGGFKKVAKASGCRQVRGERGAELEQHGAGSAGLPCWMHDLFSITLSDSKIPGNRTPRVVKAANLHSTCFRLHCACRPGTRSRILQILRKHGYCPAKYKYMFRDLFKPVVGLHRAFGDQEPYGSNLS